MLMPQLPRDYSTDLRDQEIRAELKKTLAVVRSTTGALRETALHHLWFVLDSLLDHNQKPERLSRGMSATASSSR